MTCAQNGKDVESRQSIATPCIPYLICMPRQMGLDFWVLNAKTPVGMGLLALRWYGNSGEVRNALACFDDSDSATCGRHGPGHVVGVGSRDLPTPETDGRWNLLTISPDFLYAGTSLTYCPHVCGLTRLAVYVRAGRKRHWFGCWFRHPQKQPFVEPQGVLWDRLVTTRHRLIATTWGTCHRWR